MIHAQSPSCSPTDILSRYLRSQGHPLMSNETRELLRPEEVPLERYLEMKNLPKAIKTFCKFAEWGRPIAIASDYDTDGITSALQIILACKALNLKYIYTTPVRETEGYGLNSRITSDAQSFFNQQLAEEKILIETFFTKDNLSSDEILIFVKKNFSESFAKHLAVQAEDDPFFQATQQTAWKILLLTELHKHDGLLFCLDMGTSNKRELGQIRNSITLDHHLLSQDSPRQETIFVNPCDNFKPYLSEPFATGGITYLFAYGLQQALQENIKIDLNLCSILALIATIGDVAPLNTPGNRAITALGIKNLLTSQDPFIKEVFGQKINLTPSLEKFEKEEIIYQVSDIIGYYISPVINAQGRIADPLLVTKIFFEKNPTIRKAGIETLIKINNIRKGIQSLATRTLIKKLNSRESLPPGIAVSGTKEEGFRKGVLGLLASKVSQIYQCPAIVFCQAGQGSGRSVKGINLVEILATIKKTNPEVIIKFGGHSMAAGLTIKANSLAIFQERFQEECTKQQITPSNLESVALPLSLAQLTPEFIRCMSTLAPFGNGFPKPLFILNNLKVLEAKKLKDLDIWRLRVLEQQNSLLNYETDVFIPMDLIKPKIGEMLTSDQANKIQLTVIGSVRISTKGKYQGQICIDAQELY